MIPAGDPAISRSQREGMVVPYRRFGPMLHPRRVRITQAQLKVGRSVRRQAGYKTGVVSTIIPRGSRCPELLEHLEPVQVLPMRKRAGIAVLRTPRRPFSSESIWRLRVTKFGM
jgi:hypothetical protein